MIDFRLAKMHCPNMSSHYGTVALYFEIFYRRCIRPFCGAIILSYLENIYP